MTTTRLLYSFATIGLLLFATAAADEQSISLQDRRDKVKGGWVGQRIGVSYWAPTEFQYLNQMIPEDELPERSPEMISEMLNQDGLYVDITFATALDHYGLDATPDQFGEMFRDTEFALWHANLSARRALPRGVPGHLSGTLKYNIYANDIDFHKKGSNRIFEISVRPLLSVPMHGSLPQSDKVLPMSRK